MLQLINTLYVRNYVHYHKLSFAQFHSTLQMKKEDGKKRYELHTAEFQLYMNLSWDK